MRRNVQVLLGVVIANGFPLAHHLFPGNTADKATFQTVIDDLEQRLGLRRVLVVGDRGLVSEANLGLLQASGRQMRYLMGIPGRRNEESARALQVVADDAWQTVDDSNRTQEVELPEHPGVRYFVVDSAERKAYEQELRRRSMERTRARLEKVAAAVSAGRLKNPAKIGARAARALEQDHGGRYYSYEVPGPGEFEYHEDADKLATETCREGRYVLKSNDSKLIAEEVVPLYKQLSDVEWAYRDLKDIIRMRPIHHRTDERIEAHLFVATLALFLKRTLEHELAKAGLNLTPTQAFAAMHSMGIGILDLAGEPRHLVSAGGRDARRIVKALGIDPLAPPAIQ
jgi:transposase